jgi:hypothetical protein
MSISLRPLAVAALALIAAPLAAQEQSAAPAALPPANVCGQQVSPAAQPAPGSAPVVLFIAPCFEAQGNQSVIEPQTYLYYIQQKFSTPSRNQWVPYNEASEKTIQTTSTGCGTRTPRQPVDRRQRLQFPTGRSADRHLQHGGAERVKIVDYVGSKKIEVSKIDEKLKDATAQIRLDSFIDPGLVRKVEGIVRDMLREKGFQFANVTHEIKDVPGGPKLIHITFNMDEGPKVKIRKIEFTGNKAVSDGTLKKQLKENKEQGPFTDFIHFPTWFLSLIGDHGTYQEQKFDEDAEKIVSYYRDQGYLRANVGVPELKEVADSDDKKTRWVELKIPITEGPRYKVGSFDVAGDDRQDRLSVSRWRGQHYGEKRTAGLRRRARSTAPAATWTSPGSRSSSTTTRTRTSPRPRRAKAPEAPKAKDAAPIVDVTMRMQEGSSSSSTASPSPATRPRATTSSAARCGSSKTVCSTPKR